MPLNHDVYDKLSFHIEAFQEGFSILLSSKNRSELIKKFYKILKGNLIVKNISIYHSESGREFLPVYPENISTVKEPIEKSTGSISLNISEKRDSISIVLPISGKESYYIELSEKLSGGDFSTEDEINLKLFGQLLINTIKLLSKVEKEKVLVFSLNNKILQLNSLIDTGIELTKMANHSNLIGKSLERAVSITNASFGNVTIVKDNQLVEKIWFPFEAEIDLSVLDKYYLITERLEYQDLAFEYNLINKESRKGIIPFDDTDYLLASAIAKQVKAALENNFLLNQLLDKQKIEQELEFAATIQKRIIPESVPEIEGYSVSGINIPSKEVGGDYFDVIKLKDDKYALVIADVTGKGVPAALLVSTLNAALKSYLDLDLPLGELTEKLNRVITDSSTSDTYITFIMAILDPSGGKINLINAGHNPALLLDTNNNLKEIKAGGFALGLFDDGFPFKTQDINLEIGDRLFFFTDGISEAMNEKSEEFSDERLELFFKEYKPESAQEFIDKLLEEVKSFAGETPQSDDITAIYLLRNNG